MVILKGCRCIVFVLVFGRCHERKTPTQAAASRERKREMEFDDEEAMVVNF